MKALAMGACALAVLVAPAAGHAPPAPKGGLQAKLRHQQAALDHDRRVIRFFSTRRWLLTDRRFGAEARKQLSTHRAHLALTMRRLTATRAALERKERRRKLAIARSQSPRSVICRVFGRYCGQALAVAVCESNLQPRARNGQYLGLFQMGLPERRLFGHGSDVEEQAKAALRYFVHSGRDWSPWPTCGRLFG